MTTLLNTDLVHLTVPARPALSAYAHPQAVVARNALPAQVPLNLNSTQRARVDEVIQYTREDLKQSRHSSAAARVAALVALPQQLAPLLAPNVAANLAAVPQRLDRLEATVQQLSLRYVNSLARDGPYAALPNSAGDLPAAGAMPAPLAVVQAPVLHNFATFASLMTAQTTAYLAFDGLQPPVGQEVLVLQRWVGAVSGA
ncbi:hypothetical protein Rhopal_003224-T1 [Rhodotorula paludigena]|uniref:Uncharacterized protein n=1 Tax=Rhodotorula paludigena TaxID=86838 RepID=A0AAV5GL24_9BASI|nr:hypothetical protein Rhopal_003224-T1 [Rhodotorula paludigena]